MTAQPAFTLAPSTPNIAQPRAAAQRSMDAWEAERQSAEEPQAFNSLDAPDVPELDNVELKPDDDISITLGCIVRYEYRGYGSFDGRVTDIDAAGRVEVEMSDEWGQRRYWCAADRLVLLLCKEAAALDKLRIAVVREAAEVA